jgi:membrane AbrB-like protein
MPAGMVEMVLQGGASGGDERWIALIHGGRILVVVFAVPFLFQYFGGVDISSRGQLATPKQWPGGADVLILTVTAIVGWWLAALVRLPAAQLTGPMLLSAAAHLAGLTAAAPPRELVNIAQVVLGTSVGSQFIGTPLAFFAKALGHSFVVVAIMLAMTLGLSLSVSWLVSGIDLAMMVLALAPGGLIEMGLIALALGADLAFVSLHQLLRIFLITFAATWFYRLLFSRPDRARGGNSS